MLIVIILIFTRNLCVISNIMENNKFTRKRMTVPRISIFFYVSYVLFHEQLYAHFHDATFPEGISHLSFLWRAISCKRTSSATSICSKLNKAISRFVTFEPYISILERVLESLFEVKCRKNKMPFVIPEYDNYIIFRECSSHGNV